MLYVISVIERRSSHYVTTPENNSFDLGLQFATVKSDKIGKSLFPMKKTTNIELYNYGHFLTFVGYEIVI